MPKRFNDDAAAHEARIARLMGGHHFPFIDERPDGIKVTMMSQDAIRACPHFIMMPEHYNRPGDGRCRCDDVTHTEMASWGYEWDAEHGRWT